MTPTALYAPEADDLLRFRGGPSSDLNLPATIRSQALIALLNNIVPSGENGLRSLWIPAKRGPIGAFGDYNEMHGRGEVESYEEFEAFWHLCYPDDEYWYRVAYSRHRHDHQISVNDRLTIRITDDGCDDHYDGSADVLLDWLIEGTENCIRQCAQGTYNRSMRERLPYDMRAGTLLRRDLWDVFPEKRIYHHARITDDDIARFETLFGESAEGTVLNDPLPGMSAERYFEACLLGYQALGLTPPQTTDATPRDWYHSQANPQGHALEHIDGRSPETFAAWFAEEKNRQRCWEIRPGGGFTWMSMIPVRHDDGWSFELRSGCDPLHIETAIFALALYDAGLPVSVHHAATVARALRGEDHIGIVPHYVSSEHYGDFFPQDTEIIDYMALPPEHRQEIIGKTQWLPIQEVRIVS